MRVNFNRGWHRHRDWSINWHRTVNWHWNTDWNSLRYWYRSILNLFNGIGALNWDWPVNRYCFLHWNRHTDRNINSDWHVTRYRTLHRNRNLNRLWYWDRNITWLDNFIRNWTIHWNRSWDWLMDGVRHSSFFQDFIWNWAVNWDWSWNRYFMWHRDGSLNNTFNRHRYAHRNVDRDWNITVDGHLNRNWAFNRNRDVHRSWNRDRDIAMYRDLNSVWAVYRLEDFIWHWLIYRHRHVDLLGHWYRNFSGNWTFNNALNRVWARTMNNSFLNHFVWDGTIDRIGHCHRFLDNLLDRHRHWLMLHNRIRARPFDWNLNRVWFGHLIWRRDISRNRIGSIDLLDHLIWLRHADLLANRVWSIHGLDNLVWNRTVDRHRNRDMAFLSDDPLLDRNRHHAFSRADIHNVSRAKGLVMMVVGVEIDVVMRRMQMMRGMEMIIKMGHLRQRGN